MTNLLIFGLKGKGNNIMPKTKGEVKKLLRKLPILFVPVYLIAAIVIFIDPYFHFHKPLSFMSYVLDEGRYQNYGMLKHFDYDSIFTGTSIMENIKVTEVDKLFGTKMIKVPFAGGYFSEISLALNKAMEKKAVKKVFMAVDYTKFINAKYDYWGNDDFKYPRYLYDDDILNDMEYIFSFKVLQYCFLDIKNTIKGIPSTNMDDYGNWFNHCIFGKEAVLKQYERKDREEAVSVGLTEKEKSVIKENIQKNLVFMAQKYPDTEFIFYFPPFSILYWDSINQENKINEKIEEIKMAIEELIVLKNVKVYYFVNAENIITDFNNYKDITHYGIDADKYILNSCKNDVNRLTKENYLEYLEESKELFENYNYDSIFK